MSADKLGSWRPLSNFEIVQAGDRMKRTLRCQEWSPVNFSIGMRVGECRERMNAPDAVYERAIPAKPRPMNWGSLNWLESELYKGLKEIASQTHRKRCERFFVSGSGVDETVWYLDLPSLAQWSYTVSANGIVSS